MFFYQRFFLYKMKFQLFSDLYIRKKNQNIENIIGKNSIKSQNNFLSRQKVNKLMSRFGMYDAIFLGYIFCSFVNKIIFCILLWP